jgi:hypothetical protein
LEIILEDIKDEIRSTQKDDEVHLVATKAIRQELRKRKKAAAPTEPDTPALGYVTMMRSITFFSDNHIDPDEMKETEMPLQQPPSPSSRRCPPATINSTCIWNSTKNVSKSKPRPDGEWITSSNVSFGGNN